MGNRFWEQELAEASLEARSTRVYGSQSWHREKKVQTRKEPRDFWEMKSSGAGRHVRITGSDVIQARHLTWSLAVPTTVSELQPVTDSFLFHALFYLRPSRWLRFGLPSRGLAVAGETVKDSAGQALMSSQGPAPTGTRPQRGESGEKSPAAGAAVK